MCRIFTSRYIAIFHGTNGPVPLPSDSGASCFFSNQVNKRWDLCRHGSVADQPVMLLSPRGRSGLEAKILASASASKLWPRPRPWPQTFGLGLASISLSYYVIEHWSGKNRVKFGNFVNFSGNNLKLYVVNHYLVLFHNYFWPRPRPQPLEIDLGLGLSLEVLASFSITENRSTSSDTCLHVSFCGHVNDVVDIVISRSITSATAKQCKLILFYSAF